MQICCELVYSIYVHIYVCILTLLAIKKKKLLFITNYKSKRSAEEGLLYRSGRIYASRDIVEK